MRRNFSGEIARKSRKFQQNSEFSAELGGIEAEMCRDGRVVAQQHGKLRAQSLFCARVDMVVTIIIMYR